MLIGLGKVNITCGASGHSLHLISGLMQACRLNLVGAVCVSSEHADLTMADCRVEDRKGQGLVVMSDGCTFRKLDKQAVEVRGGTARLLECHSSKCRRGVTASGGLQLLELHRCRIEGIHREGVLVSGKNRSTGTHIEVGLEEPRANLPGERAARGVETCVHTAGSQNLPYYGEGLRGSHGLLLDDMDANVCVLNSKLFDNAPAAYYVKVHSLIIVFRCSLVWFL